MTEELSDLLKARRTKLEDLRKKGIDPYPYRYVVTHKAADIVKDFSENLEVSIAGRVITRRGHGKASFAHIMDDSGKVQVYAKIDVLGEEKYDLFTKLDIGDFIGVKGAVFKTKTGEITVKISELVLLAKSLHPLPEKWHGLQDKELRYRERYVDLMVNPEVKEVFIKRCRIISLIRKFLEDRGFLEVETPVLHAMPGGAAAKPFSTFHDALGMDLYLRIAPELYLKRLVVAGFEKIFELGRVFRNEGMSYKHNPEYTMLEVYQAYADFEDIMKLTEEMIVKIIMKIHGKTTIEYKGEALDFTPPWKRISLVSALKEAGIDIEVGEEGIRKIAKQKGIEGAEEIGVGKIINTLYDKFVEPNLIQPTFIVDYPIETSPLAKKKRDNPKLVERFEMIVAGMEMANAFSELNDPIDQRERFKKQLELRAAGDTEAESMDEDFLRALEYGMPPTGGLGIGIDRLVMILTGQLSIRDVLFFPHMKPLSEAAPKEEEMDILDK
ncbi:MAG: lysine--tRNA ligase [Candidatus Saganbacteria bacterium]|nr:lysine--tRNA ligase [Candidatus Saganbacteria bacterium]